MQNVGSKRPSGVDSEGNRMQKKRLARGANVSPVATTENVTRNDGQMPVASSDYDFGIRQLWASTPGSAQFSDQTPTTASHGSTPSIADSQRNSDETPADQLSTESYQDFEIEMLFANVRLEDGEVVDPKNQPGVTTETDLPAQQFSKKAPCDIKRPQARAR